MAYSLFLTNKYGHERSVNARTGTWILQPISIQRTIAASWSYMEMSCQVANVPTELEKPAGSNHNNTTPNETYQFPTEVYGSLSSKTCEFDKLSTLLNTSFASALRIQDVHIATTTTTLPSSLIANSLDGNFIHPKSCQTTFLSLGRFLEDALILKMGYRWIQ